MCMFPQVFINPRERKKSAYYKERWYYVILRKWKKVRDKIEEKKNGRNKWATNMAKTGCLWFLEKERVSIKV